MQSTKLQMHCYRESNEGTMMMMMILFIYLNLSEIVLSTISFSIRLRAIFTVLFRERVTPLTATAEAAAVEASETER